MFRLRAIIIAGCAVAGLAAVAALTYGQRNFGGFGGYGGGGLASPPAKASVTIAGKLITVDYYAPSMRGRKIMGGLVPYGEVWCTGANVATGFTTQADLQIGNLKLPKGKYSIWTLPTEKEWTLIVNKQSGQHHLDYEPDRDFGRTKMNLKTLSAPVEVMKIDLAAAGGKSGTLGVSLGEDGSLDSIHGSAIAAFEKRRRKLRCLTVAFLCVRVVAFAQSRAPDVPFVTSSPPIVSAMLKLADVKASDVVYDLGCGDGRIVIAAAKEFGAHGFGIDIDPELVRRARANAKQAGVEDLVRFEEGDLFESDIHEATVVTIYLMSGVNLRLRPKLLSDLKPGSRVISHSFTMGDWTPEKREYVDGSFIYRWTVPKKPVN